MLEQPRLGIAQIPLNRPGRNVKQFRRLRFVQSDKKPQFDHFRLLRREHGQFIESRVNLQKPFVISRHGDFNGVQINALAFSSMARAKFSPGAFDENVAHGLGGGGEKMSAVLPSWHLSGSQPQPRFVNQRRGLESVARGLLRHLDRGQAAQPLVNQRQQFLRSGDIAMRHGFENVRDVAHGKNGARDFPCLQRKAASLELF